MRVPMRHPTLPDRVIVARPAPEMLRAGWEPIPESGEPATPADAEPDVAVDDAAQNAPAEQTAAHESARRGPRRKAKEERV